MLFKELTTPTELLDRLTYEESTERSAGLFWGIIGLIVFGGSVILTWKDYD